MNFYTESIDKAVRATAFICLCLAIYDIIQEKSRESEDISYGQSDI